MPERERVAPHILHDLTAGNPQERPHDRHGPRVIQAPRGRHSSQACWPGTAQEIHENCFGLVIGGVPRDDGRASAPSSHQEKHSIPKVPARFFDTQTTPSGKSLHIHDFYTAGQVPSPGKGFDEPGVRCGPFAQAVVDVTDDQPIWLAAEKMGQRHGVRPP